MKTRPYLDDSMVKRVGSRGDTRNLNSTERVIARENHRNNEWEKTRRLAEQRRKGKRV